MTLFESTLTRLFLAILLLQISRRVAIPYPTLLAIAGAAAAARPGLALIRRTEPGPDPGAGCGGWSRWPQPRALPASFPGRDLIVLSAPAVVLGTLVIQGLTLAPLIRLRRRTILVKRALLAEMRRSGRIDDDVFHALEQDLDWAELAASPPERREIRDV